MTIIILIITLSILAVSVFIALKIKTSNLSKEELNSAVQENSERLAKRVSEEISLNRKESAESAKSAREEILSTLSKLNSVNSQTQKDQLDSFSTTLKNISETQLKNLDNMNKSLNELSKTLDNTLKTEIRFLQEKNENKLEEMRKTVDEQLQSTLEKRLSESFKTVSQQLENVYKGIGEMTKLAADVGDLKRVLTNVKARGVFGELQLKNILDDILTKDQYEENVKIKTGNVEFAIKIPSKDENGKHILLPIDSKFPREDYEKILDAQQKASPEDLKEAVKALSNRVKSEAKDIFEKYINPPETTDFAIMFFPCEGLFAEVLRIPGFFEDIRKTYNVVITGPTTITAILNSLQMGFRTLAIEKRSHEVWKILAAVKKEFHTFADNLAKTRKKLEEAANNIEKAEKRSQIIGKKLKGVEVISAQESQDLLELEEENDQETAAETKEI